MPEEINKFIYWTPRVLSIIFCLFLAMFSLDVFGNDYGFWETLLALFMHNIPVFILTVIIWISWKREIIGGITFILAGLLYVTRTFFVMFANGFEWYYLAWDIQIAGPAFLTGVLYILCWNKKKGKAKTSNVRAKKKR